MRLRKLVVLFIMGSTAMIGESEAVPLENLHWKNRVLVVVAPDGDPAAAEQRQIYPRSEQGMSDRAIVFIEALGDGDRGKFGCS